MAYSVLLGVTIPPLFLELSVAFGLLRLPYVLLWHLLWLLPLQPCLPGHSCLGKPLCSGTSEDECPTEGFTIHASLRVRYAARAFLKTFSTGADRRQRSG